MTAARLTRRDLLRTVAALTGAAALPAGLVAATAPAPCVLVTLFKPVSWGGWCRSWLVIRRDGTVLARADCLGRFVSGETVEHLRDCMAELPGLLPASRQYLLSVAASFSDPGTSIDPTRLFAWGDEKRAFFAGPDGQADYAAIIADPHAPFV